MGVNPAVRSRIPIRIRIERMYDGGFRFEWYLRRYRYNRRTGKKIWYWKNWRGYVSPKRATFREALAQYREYAEYWRTGRF